VLRKRIGPNLWDVSLAEHLSIGETFKEAALRGLQEELGICAPAIAGPLAPTFRRSLQVFRVPFSSSQGCVYCIGDRSKSGQDKAIEQVL
jgi:hypothetical protein